MATWERAILTTQGLALMAKLATGHTLSLSRAVAGTGTVDPAELCDLTAIAGENIEMSFATVKYTGNGKCSVPVRLSNAEISEPVTVNQIGVMAIDPDEGEILYMVCQSKDGNGTEIPSNKDVPSYMVGWNFVLTYGMADGVTVVVDPAGTVSREELETVLNTHIETINVEINQIKADLSQKAPIHAVACGITTEGDGAAYTATVEGITALVAGANFTMIPHVVSTAKLPTLDVNGLGAKMIRRRVSNSTVTTVSASVENWLAAGKPIRVFFDGSYWVADFTRPNANDIYGIVDIASGGTGASTPEAARASLGAQAQHQKAKVTLPANGWKNNQQTVSVPGVLADEDECDVIVSAAKASRTAYNDAVVYCSAQGDDQLTFACDETPSADITVNVLILT